MPRHLLALALSASALILAGSPAAATAAKAPLCQDRPGTTYAAADGFRVYGTSVRDRKDRDHRTVSICSCKTGSRTTKLLHRYETFIDSFTAVRHVALGGTPFRKRAAITLGVATVDSELLSVLLVDLTTGRQTIPRREGLFLPETFVTTDGGLVYQADGKGLVAVDSAGERTLVPLTTNSFDRDVADLAVGGNRIYWTDAGNVSHAATLTGQATLPSA